MFCNGATSRVYLKKISVIFSISLLSGVISTRDANAVGTRVFEFDSAEKLVGGEQKGTAVTSAGEVEAGWIFNRTSIVKGATVFSALERPDGSVLLGVGPEGRVLKIDAAGRESIVADLKTIAVSALVEGPGGKVYASTIGSGSIFVIEPNVSVGVNPSAASAPAPKAFAKLPTEHIWSLVYDKKRDELFAGTGPDGKIFRVDKTGKFQIFHTIDDSQVISMAMSSNGTLYAGSSTKGMLVAITAPGRSEIVYKFTGSEVKAIAFGPSGPDDRNATESLYCIVNEHPTTMTSSFSDLSRRLGIGGSANGSGSGRSPLSPLAMLMGALGGPPDLASRGASGKGELWKFTGLNAGFGGRPERLYRDETGYFMSLAVQANLDRVHNNHVSVYVGSGADGRVIRVDDAHKYSVVAKSDARQIGAIGLGGVGHKGPWFASSDAAAFHRVTSIGGPNSTWTSRVLDAGIRAQFGRIAWQSTGALEFQLRTGGSPTPNETWSEWSTAIQNPGKVKSFANRYVQLRARWRANTALLRSVSLAFVTDNLRPVVLEIATSPTKASAPTTGVPSSGTDVPIKSMTLRLAWKTDNPDNDMLRYRLWYRRQDSAFWRPLIREDEPIATTDLSWNTEAIADGFYQVRVQACDEIANPMGLGLCHSLESAPLLIDHTPPTLRMLQLRNGRLQAEVNDSMSTIARIEVQIDGRLPWRPLTSIDGILDELTEKVDTDLGLTTGPHVVAIRIYDAAGNSVIREVEAR